MRRATFVRVFTATALAVGTVGAGASMASATKADPHKVTICHATASKSNPYVVITVDGASIGDDSGHGRSGVNIGDIIPPFDIAGVHYDGNNWDSAHAPIALRECGFTIPVTPPSDDSGGISGGGINL